MKKHGNIQMEVDGVRCSDVSIMRILKKIVNDNIVRDVFIICQKLRHIQVIKKKNTVLVLIDLQSNPPKCPQSTVGTLF